MKEYDNSMNVMINPDVTEKEPVVDKETSERLLRSLVKATHEEDFNREGYVKVIHEICEKYHLSRGDSEFYANVGMERRKEGEYFCDFDDGTGTVLLLRNRIVAKSGAVIISTLYLSENAELPSLEDVNNLDLMLRLIMSFISRRRLQGIVEQYIFFDENGYPNMRYFQRELMRLEEEKKLPGMVAMHLDLHNFAVINMEIGRENGDTVIQNYNNLLEEAVGDKGCIARLGGDKFLGIFSKEAEPKVLEILKGVPIAYDDAGERRVNVSAAVGIYEVPLDVNNSKQDILERMFIASSIAKKQEEGAIVFYNERFKASREHAKMIQQKFREGLKKEEFLIYYQPKVDVVTKKIVGAEALSRWSSGGRIVMPGEFIPILEQTTDICDLDFYVLDHVCKDIKVWIDKGNEYVRASINFSRKHLSNPDLLDRILKIVDDNGVPHDAIEIELTETTTDVQFRDLKRVVNGLKDAGIHTAVDDFGVGYSSLNLIREIPWDVLKIDRCFLPLDDDDEKCVTSMMFRHVIAMAQDLGLECVVEGVETLKQVDILRQNCCNVAQGFYFDKPLPKLEFEARLLRAGYADRD